MSKEQETLYKLHLAYNLIAFLIDSQTYELTPEKKGERTELLLNGWAERVNSYLQKINKEEVTKIAKSGDVGEDVIKILMDINQLGHNTIRKEFTIEMKDYIFKSLAMET